MRNSVKTKSKGTYYRTIIHFYQTYGIPIGRVTNSFGSVTISRYLPSRSVLTAVQITKPARLPLFLRLCLSNQSRLYVFGGQPIRIYMEITVFLKPIKQKRIYRYKKTLSYLHNMRVLCM